MRFVLLLARVLASCLAVLIVVDLGLRVAFPHFLRVHDNFSAAYLRREITEGGLDRKVVFLGDSVLWGYRLHPAQAAVSQLSADGIPAENLSFEGGSTVNTYAILRLMTAWHIKPRAVVFNVNLKEFNAEDSAYRTLYPGLEQLVWPYLTRHERSLLKETQKNTLDAKLDRFLSNHWMLYGMRADIRATLFGSADAGSAVHAMVNYYSGEYAREQLAHQPTPDKFLGTYDLTPLDDTNVEVVYLQKIVSLLKSQHIEAYALLTPQNHQLLHDYIDTPEYDQQLAYVAHILRPGGVHVLDYDKSIPPRDFLDNDHLTVSGNRRLASMLRRDVNV